MEPKTCTDCKAPIGLVVGFDPIPDPAADDIGFPVRFIDPNDFNIRHWYRCKKCNIALSKAKSKPYNFYKKG